MKTGERLTIAATSRPRTVAMAMAVASVFIIMLVLLPMVAPGPFSFLHQVAVDTDPENMLSHDEPVRLLHDEMKQRFNLHDMIVVGVVNDAHPEGVFNVATLRNVFELTEFAKTLRGAALGEEDPRAGVVEMDILAPSTVDNIEQAGIGTVRFEWLMAAPPETDEEALAVRDKALRMPFLEGTLVSEDGKALAIYLPLTRKDLSYKIYRRLQAKVAEFSAAEQYHITGLPVAEDTFGVEMFIQMGLSAPLAMLAIFLLMLYFFRKLVLIISPLIVALVSVILTMGLLIVTGNTIHIMSSMIPIFIMPIAVLDSVHILSEFFDRYREFNDRRKTILHVMEDLFPAMLFTSLTSSAGFLSLALTPIPPVQVFGIFVAVGIMFAWFLTIVFVPAYVMLIPERSFANFGLSHQPDDDSAHPSPLARALHGLGEFSYGRTKLVFVMAGVAVFLAVYGISQIEVNDNPTRWFRASHPIRVADRVLNEHFGGTYMAYLALSAPEDTQDVQAFARALEQQLASTWEDADALKAWVASAAENATSSAGLVAALREQASVRAEAATGEESFLWDDLLYALDEEGQRAEVFKQPEALAYIARLQEAFLQTGEVGKSNSLTDIVKTVHRELFEGEAEAFRIPETARGVAQTLITFEGSHRPHDLYHFVTPDYRQTSIWVQLRSGDNRDMSELVEEIEAFMAENPPPFGLYPEWFGLTYINVIWQEKMVVGMLESFLGSFLVVFLMMTLLFRSALWGLIAMVPLTLTVGLIYGVVGLVGKDYDMPVAVLSSLTLGLAVDFAIHFLVRARRLYQDQSSWAAVHKLMFGEPARAITRNIIVIAVGFLPLLAAPLVPYNTVGVFLASILVMSGLATLLLLPALLKTFESLLFPRTRACAITCQCGTCVVSAVAVLVLVAVNLHQFLELGWTQLTTVSVAILPVLALGCFLMSRREQCKKLYTTDGEPCPDRGQDAG